MSTPQPLVSFIVPCYNVAGQLLRECLASLASPELAPFGTEIIVVDDGSEQWPDEVEAEFAGKMQVVHAVHAGVSAARNRGLAEAGGKYVHFIDADDRILPEAYLPLLEMAKHSAPDAFLLGADGVGIDDGMSGADYMLRHNLRGAVWNYLFLRTAALAVRFTEGVAYAEDEEFTARLISQAKRIACYPTLPYSYRPHPASATRQRSPQALLRRFDDTEGVLIRLRQHCDNATDTPRREALERRIAQLTMDYLYNILTLTRDENLLKQRIDRLRQAHLYPMPAKRYTLKYIAFRRLMATAAGRFVLKLITRHAHPQTT